MTVYHYLNDQRVVYYNAQGVKLNPGSYDRVDKSGNDSPKKSGDRLTPHAYTHTITSYYDPVGVSAVTREEGTPQSWSGLPGYVSSPPWPTSLDNHLLVQLREKILESDWNPAVTMGEARESLHMIGQRTGQLVRAFTSARRLDVVGVARALRCAVLPPRNRVRVQVNRFLQKTRGMTEKQLEQLGYHLVKRKLGESLYLEYTFGWVPLLSDVHSAMVALSAMEGRELVSSVRVRKSLHPPLKPEWQEQVTRYSKQLLHFIKSPGSNVFYKNVDPLETIWELVPFSFVIDWFLPVGDYLSAMAAQRVIRNSGETWLTYVERKSVRGYAWYHAPSKTTTVVPSYRYFSLSMTRSKSSISAKVPTSKGWTAVLEYNRAASAIALLLQVFRK